MARGTYRHRVPDAALQQGDVHPLAQPVSSALARKRVQVCEYPDGRIEIRHDGDALPYRVFDKMRQVNQAAIVDNKHLDAAIEVARLIQEATPHHRNRNNNEPSRSSQSFGLFAKPAAATGPKIDRRTLGKQKLKRGPRLSDEDLIARGLGQYALNSASR